MRRTALRAAAVAATGLGVVIAAAPAALAATVDTSPHNYMGDGSTVDTYGSGPLTWSGTPSYTPVNGTYPGDKAFFFDGASGLSAPDSTVTNYGTRNFTMSFTFATTTHAQQALVNKRADCTSGGQIPFFSVRLGAGPDRIAAELNDPADNAVVTLPVSLTDGTYHTVFVTRAGNRLTLSVDGDFATTTTPGVVNLDSPAPLRIGSDPCDGVDGTQAFSGAVNSLQFNVTVPPTASLPEAPYTVALGLAGMGVFGSAVVIRRRRAA